MMEKKITVNKTEQEKGILTIGWIAMGMVVTLLLSVLCVGVAEAAPVDDAKLYAQCYSLATNAGNADDVQKYGTLLQPYLPEHNYYIMYTVAYTDGYVRGIASMVDYPIDMIAKQLSITACRLTVTNDVVGITATN